LFVEARVGVAHGIAGVDGKPSMEAPPGK
jgi:hypothetical protein